MKSSTRFLPFVLAPLLVVAGCASDGPPVSDPSVGVSGRKHYGEEHEISLYKLLGRDRGSTGEAAPAVGDPEYQEYLEWKRWKEFKEFQKWKSENPEAATSAAPPES